IEQATIFFGQGMTASSIQLTAAMAAIANGGKLMRPFVVKSVADQYGRIIKKTRPHMVRRVISSETAHRVALILEGVVGEKGTGPQAAISGYRVAGKTGTSQKVDPRTKKYSRKKYVAVFVGFVPVKNPRLVILAMVDEPAGNPYGGIVAGPVFRKVGGWTLNHMRIHPDLRLVQQDLEKGPVEDDPGNTASSAPQVFDGEGGSDRLPNFKGQSMREVLTAGRALGLKVILEGTGLAYSQTPGPGTALQHTRIVKVNFRPPM
ncbi:penicillin-binding transpeptidase domain-containing protein, partial [Thermodesulfobacteriota bacterium]